jgi:hypothetical protein
MYMYVCVWMPRVRPHSLPPLLSVCMHVYVYMYVNAICESHTCMHESVIIVFITLQNQSAPSQMTSMHECAYACSYGHDMLKLTLTAYTVYICVYACIHVCLCMSMHLIIFTNTATL